MVLNGTKMNIAEINEIRRLQGEFKSDKEIIDLLKIPHMTYYRYKKKLCFEDKKLLEKERHQTAEHHIMQVKRALEYCITICKKICEESQDDKARIDACITLVKANMGLLQLLKEGPNNESVKILAREVTDNTKRLQSIKQ